MARLNDAIESDEELPEHSTILRPQTDAIVRNLAKQEHGKMSSSGKEIQNLASEDLWTERHTIAPGIVSTVSSDKPQSRKQRPLGHITHSYVNSLLLPILDASTSNSKSEFYQSTDTAIDTADSISNRASPRRPAKVTADYSELAHVLARTSIFISDDEGSSTDLSGFIVPDSASDEEIGVSKSPKKRSRSPKKISTAYPQEPGFPPCRRPQYDRRQRSKKTDLYSPEKKKYCRICPESPPSNEPFRSELVEAHPNLDDRLTFSPPKSRSPYKSKDDSHPLTPPSSPSKSKLKSPTKRHRIPPSPHRPSIDAFWSQDVINDWNEQYSLRKIVESPRKFRLRSTDEDQELFPPESPRKSPMKSSAKKDKKLFEQRKLFDDKKHELATAFLAEVDRTITNGQVASMAQSTGGIQIIWSKKLSSTAGRANWRRDAIRSKNADGVVSNTTHLHYASIELAEKVIDDEDRLLNVVAHEYCHLANFMISGIKDNPHGKEFKEWARKCTNAFSHINVTTKHTYTISYKYIWACMSPICGLEYKRHSKSIDPSRHLCGNCKGKLVQVQPAQRKGAGEGKRSEYQDFVKRENERVRLENPAARFGEIMSILGREFKERKRNEAERASSVEENGALEKTVSNDLECLDSVIRKLDFLNLES